MNKVILKGRLTKDIELKTTSSGVSVCSFSIAVNRAYGEKQADFIDIVAWRSTAEFISKYFTKGQEIILVGELQARTYEDKSGNNRKVVEVVANEVEFCGSKQAAKNDTAPEADFSGFEFGPEPADGDLPF